MVPVICEGLLCIEDAFEKGEEELFEAPRTVKETALEEGWRLSWDADLNGGGNDPIWLCPRCVVKLEEGQNEEVRERNGHSGAAPWSYPVGGRSRRPRPPFPGPGPSISPTIDPEPDYLEPDPSGLVNVQADDPLAEPPLVDPRTGMIARREVWDYPWRYPVTEPDLVSVFRTQQEGREREWASGSVSPSAEPEAEASDWSYPVIAEDLERAAAVVPALLSLTDDQVREVIRASEESSGRAGCDRYRFYEAEREEWLRQQERASSGTEYWDLEVSREEVEHIDRALVEADREPFVTGVSDSSGGTAEVLPPANPHEVMAAVTQTADRLGVFLEDFTIQLSETARESIERFEQALAVMRASIAATVAVSASSFEGLSYLVSTGIEEEEEP